MTRVAAAAVVSVLVLLAVFAVPAYAWTDVEEPPTASQAYADVELDIFSGRPNPHWNISADQIAPLLPKVDAPQLATSGEPPGLGYRGFLLTYVSAEPDTPTVYRVYAGTVSIGTGDTQTTVADAKGLEQWLLEDARSRGYGDLLEEISVTPPLADPVAAGTTAVDAEVANVTARTAVRASAAAPDWAA